MNLDWLDHISYPMLIVLAVFLALAPFHPEPHLVEKFRMLREGTLKRPLDIFDFFYHLAPIVLLAIKAGRDWLR